MSIMCRGRDHAFMVLLAEKKAFAPQPPTSLEQIGIASSQIDDLLLKRLFNGGPQTAGSVADRLALPFLVVLNNLNELRRRHHTHVLGSDGYGERNYVYVLTEEGESRARTAFDRNLYDGYAPVPLTVYNASVLAQSVRDVPITKTAIEDAFRDLVLHPDIINEIGPAVNAGQSLFLYCAAGNGNAALATRITKAMGDEVYVPYSIDLDGNIIEFFDPVCH